MDPTANRGPQVTSVSSLLAALILVVLVLRLFSRAYVLRALWLDDGTEPCRGSQSTLLTPLVSSAHSDSLSLCLGLDRDDHYR